MERGGCVYIMTNKGRSVLYIGVTSDLRSRIYEHQHHKYPSSFTARYNLECCIYYEFFSDIEEAIQREKQLKGWSRSKKNDLISSVNPTWKDLWIEIETW
ncbi:putative endonuclease [bacterium A37T11]|nr:putative endonuclease [bacterium A37T11]